MNKLEELSKTNQENYQRYLRRMTESMKHSTKGLIPFLVGDSKNILDVGCGSGVLLNAIEEMNPKARLTGIDLNIDAINNLSKCNSNWKLYHKDFMDLDGEKFDTIIFSSILHEISSYHSDQNKRFTGEPIREALIKTNALLEDNGTIIIRDGLFSPKVERDEKHVVSFVNPDDGKWLYKFKKDFKGFDKAFVDTSILELKDNIYVVTEGFLKEFLCKYTWGEESYPREINEMFGVLTKDEWIKLIKEAGFKIETTIESQEEYEQYLKDRINIDTYSRNSYTYPNMTLTVKAQKIKTLK